MKPFALRPRPYVTIALLSINVLIFLAYSFIPRLGGLGEMMRLGGLYTPVAFHEIAYYRFFTSFFLHFSINHIANNMLMLGVLGYQLERFLGHGKLLLVYMLSGLGGNLISFAIREWNQQFIVSAGASGAVFGLMGALLATFLKLHRAGYPVLWKRMLVMVVLSIYVGFSNGGVDNWAHIGGLLIGFLVSMILPLKQQSMIWRTSND